MKKPYIKKYRNYYHTKVYFVDGDFVRGKIDEEFTNFGQHFRFKFIPENEFWIDKERTSGEADFFVEHMFIERKLMREGKSYVEAIDFADKIEKRERARSDLAKEIRKLPLDEVLNKIRKQKISSCGKTNIWIVSGEIVRDTFNIDFTEGGHDRVYPFVPENEVWIDDDLSKEERKFVLIHELNERYLMGKGKKYNDAHFPSSRLEYFCRKTKVFTNLILWYVKFLNR